MGGVPGYLTDSRGSARRAASIALGHVSSSTGSNRHPTRLQRRTLHAEELRRRLKLWIPTGDSVRRELAVDRDLPPARLALAPPSRARAAWGRVSGGGGGVEEEAAEGFG